MRAAPAPAVHAPAHERRAARWIHAAIGALDRVSHLTDADADPADVSRGPLARLPQAGERRGVAKAIGILETVEHIVGAMADWSDPALPATGDAGRAAGEVARNRLPLAPTRAPEPDTAGPETPARDRHGDPRGSREPGAP